MSLIKQFQPNPQPFQALAQNPGLVVRVVNLFIFLGKEKVERDLAPDDRVLLQYLASFINRLLESAEFQQTLAQNSDFLRGAAALLVNLCNTTPIAVLELEEVMGVISKLLSNPQAFQFLSGVDDIFNGAVRTLRIFDPSSPEVSLPHNALILAYILSYTNQQRLSTFLQISDLLERTLSSLVSLTRVLPINQKSLGIALRLWTTLPFNPQAFQALLQYPDSLANIANLFTSLSAAQIANSQVDRDLLGNLSVLISHFSLSLIESQQHPLLNIDFVNATKNLFIKLAKPDYGAAIDKFLLVKVLRLLNGIINNRSVEKDFAQNLGLVDAALKLLPIQDASDQIDSRLSHDAIFLMMAFSNQEAFLQSPLSNDFFNEAASLLRQFPDSAASTNALCLMAILSINNTERVGAIEQIRPDINFLVNSLISSDRFYLSPAIIHGVLSLINKLPYCSPEALRALPQHSEFVYAAANSLVRFTGMQPLMPNYLSEALQVVLICNDETWTALLRSPDFVNAVVNSLIYSANRIHSPEARQEEILSLQKLWRDSLVVIDRIIRSLSSQDIGQILIGQILTRNPNLAAAAIYSLALSVGPLYQQIEQNLLLLTVHLFTKARPSIEVVRANEQNPRFVKAVEDLFAFSAANPELQLKDLLLSRALYLVRKLSPQNIEGIRRNTNFVVAAVESFIHFASPQAVNSFAHLPNAQSAYQTSLKESISLLYPLLLTPSSHKLIKERFPTDVIFDSLKAMLTTIASFNPPNASLNKKFLILLGNMLCGEFFPDSFLQEAQVKSDVASIARSFLADNILDRNYYGWPAIVTSEVFSRLDLVDQGDGFYRNNIVENCRLFLQADRMRGFLISAARRSLANPQASNQGDGQDNLLKLYFRFLTENLPNRCRLTSNPPLDPAQQLTIAQLAAYGESLALKLLPTKEACEQDEKLYAICATIAERYLKHCVNQRMLGVAAVSVLCALNANKNKDGFIHAMRLLMAIEYASDFARGLTQAGRGSAIEVEIGNIALKEIYRCLLKQGLPELPHIIFPTEIPFSQSAANMIDQQTFPSDCQRFAAEILKMSPSELLKNARQTDNFNDAAQILFREEVEKYRQEIENRAKLIAIIYEAKQGDEADYQESFLDSAREQGIKLEPFQVFIEQLEKLNNEQLIAMLMTPQAINLEVENFSAAASERFLGLQPQTEPQPQVASQLEAAAAEHSLQLP